MNYRIEQAYKRQTNQLEDSQKKKKKALIDKMWKPNF